MSLFYIVVRVEWSFTVDSDCSHLRGFDIGEDTHPLFFVEKVHVNELSELELPYKRDICLRRPLNCRSTQFILWYVVRLISLCFEDNVKTSETSQE